ncbi:MAG: site-specific integrase [Verrucomicrobia bacterium]|nr:site-specific integrase [Verrucomicrobiota bacterium]
MKPAETKRSDVRGYKTVLDGRNQPVRRLYRRDGVFYTRFTTIDQAGRKRKVWRSLKTATTVAAAKAAMLKLISDAAETSIPVQGRCPTFAAYSERFLEEASPNKRPATQRKEKTHIAWWVERIGAQPVSRIHRTHINNAIADLRKNGLSPRTCNLYVITLRCVLKRALEEGLITSLPTLGLRPLKVTQIKRQLVSMETFERMLEVGAPSGTKNHQQFRDYYRFLLLTGAREKEALRVRWADVDFDNRQVTIGADGLAKNHEHRVVDFDSALEALLRELADRRDPDSQWLFPSPQRGEKDTPAKTFRESLRLACDHAGVARVGFHDARHHFVSKCVMAGIDFMTIAAWVGHKDGGVLIGKVYGHLASEHRKAMAAKRYQGTNR